MGWFSDAMSKVTSAKDYFTELTASYTDWAFADAIVAVVALTSAADGECEPEERKAFAKMLTSNETLARYDRTKMGARYDTLCTKALDDISREDVFEVVAKIGGDKNKLTAALKLGIYAAKSDGDFEPEEGKVLAEICERFSLDPDKVSPDILKAANKAAAK
jgi:tellurite resistance protein TerB